MRPKEQTVCGLAAVKALFARDSGAIKRLYFDYPTGRRIGIICRTLAAARRVYRCVEPAELEKIAGTVHHGGIEPRVLRPPRPEDLRRWAQTRTPLLLLDRIGNAHNLGAMVRTAAFFGVEHLVIADDPLQALPGEATYRVAEGGMEYVTIHQVKSLAEFIRELRPFFTVIGAAVRGAEALAPNAQSQPLRSPPPALVLGNEEQGLAPDVAAACERLVQIPGEGAIESLNVSAAGAILLHHFFGRGRRVSTGPSRHRESR